jgi:putative membrane protein
MRGAAMDRSSELEPAPRQSSDWLRRLPAQLRPHTSLLRYYMLASLAAGPAFPLLLLARYFRYRTLRYEMDHEGISMRWGILFRREVSLTYARIQDIHLTSNVVERWFGLARIQVQTASGSATAEMTIEGIPGFAELRDFLYARMRGTRDAGRVDAIAEVAVGSEAGLHELTATLRAVADEVRALRLEMRAPGRSGQHG